MVTAFREAVVDLAAITRNVEHLRRAIGTAHTMAVVKANGYGHGAVQAARAAVAGGADWLGVADIEEAIELRDAGLTVPILAWLHDPETDFADAITAGVDIGVSSADQLRQVTDAAERLGRPAAVQVKLETGLSRNGVHESEWAPVLTRAAELEQAGHLRVRGVFSHLSNASPEDDAEAVDRFTRGIALARAVGLRPDLTHLAASAAALRLPDSRFQMVRLGIAMYGLSPFDSDVTAATETDLGLTPAMTLRGCVAAVRRVQAGAGVSYDYTWRAPVDSNLALVPLGYADGVPRQASGRAHVRLGGRTRPLVGRIAMDQFVVDLGDDTASVGDDVVLFGDPATGAPGATDWARAAGTINYEIVTRIGNRVPRTYLNPPAGTTP
ncbi:alanine racemase [Glaciibacter superstes]|uniref:alanine racemase n=1 Tax=Glaciibacter superstes TaxID=501023 RepID=UPI000479B317|nr:alanine racemase [Glaciibacter superstes]